ncbi:aspartate/glutamate racemase family protein [Desulfovibrio sp. OttesenSCG-928-O18]|nr:aspartate/glutamate racemase family protein [Desulfovibrio sp. OttesenSCG-928-O18]
MKRKKVAMIHTSLVSYDTLKSLFAEIIPEADVVNIVDESLLAEVSANGGLTPGVIRRMHGYVVNADSLGVDLIFNQCSSVGEAFDLALNSVNTPGLKIDTAMAEEAVAKGSTIAVVATVGSTVAPSVRIVEDAGKRAGKNVTVKPYLVDGALAMLMGGKREEHDKLVYDAVSKAAEECDAVVLAQGSMFGMLPRFADMKKPVLSSPRLGVERARKDLGL